MPRDNAGDERDVDGLSVQRGDASMTTQSPAQSAHPYIGSREKLLEGDRVVTGQAQFVSDISLAGMLHAALVRSPHPHAKIRGIDTTRAERAPGVVRVVTGAEAKERLNPMPHYIEPAVFGGKHADIHCLATDKVNCVGQPVVAVVGTNLPDVLAAAQAREGRLRAAASRPRRRGGDAARGTQDRRWMGRQRSHDVRFRQPRNRRSVRRQRRNASAPPSRYRGSPRSPSKRGPISRTTTPKPRRSLCTPRRRTLTPSVPS